VVANELLAWAQPLPATIQAPQISAHAVPFVVGPHPALVLAELRRAPPPPDADSPALARVGEGMSDGESMMSVGGGCHRRGSIGECADQAEACALTMRMPRRRKKIRRAHRPTLPSVLR